MEKTKVSGAFPLQLIKMNEVIKIGYTHYWKRAKRFDEKQYRNVIADFRKVMPFLERLCLLAGGHGRGRPEITGENVCFNGVRDCGHFTRELGITWPSDNAAGVCFAVALEGGARKEYPENNSAFASQVLDCGSADISRSDVSGQWFAGALLNKRTCGGDCSHETFSFPLAIQPEEWQEPENGMYFDFCKTAYKPYDLAVNVFLIIAKHHLGNEIMVSSDGTIEQWNDAMMICEKLLGYGRDFKLGDEA